MVITGAGRGLGYEVGRQLSELNARVILTSRDAARDRVAAEHLRLLGGQVWYHPLDTLDVGSIQALGEFLQAEYGRLDILINNAGAHCQNDGAGMRVTAATMVEAFTSNCIGALQVTQGLSTLLRNSGQARVINVSTLLASPAQMSQLPGQYFAYRIAKSALNAMTAALAEEFRDSAVSVNAVHPGWLKTAMGGPFAPQPVAEGAVRVIELALGDFSNATGKFFVDGQEHPW